MESEEKDRKTAEATPGESLRQIFVALGDAFEEIFNDPELKLKAKELGDAASESAQRLGQRFKDEDVKERFRKAGEAAEVFGKSVADSFKSERKSEPHA